MSTRPRPTASRSFSTTRIASLGGLAERATGDFEGSQVGGRVEAGWRFLVQRYELTPFAGVTVQSFAEEPLRLEDVFMMITKGIVS